MKEDILDSVRKIKQYCKRIKCKKCKFYQNNNKCLFVISPCIWKIPEKEILDKIEKEYLWNIIKPFKENVKDISKKRNGLNGEYILIQMKTIEKICLPDFEQNTMYKGMRLNKNYTVKELFGK